MKSVSASRHDALRGLKATDPMSRLTDMFGAHLPGLTLSGATVHLRPPERNDWAKWAEVRGASRDFLQPWEPTWPADGLTRASFRRRLARYAVDWRYDEAYNLFIYRNSDRELVGGVSLSNLRRGVAETASVGYWIGRSHARRGYMTEALRLTCGFAFDHLHLHRLEAACLPSNMPSRGLLAKLGFVQEGYARRYLCIDGRWEDHLLLALLIEDWDRNSGVVA